MNKFISISVISLFLGVMLAATTSSFATIQQGANGLLTQIGLTKMWVSSTPPFINSGFGYNASAVLANTNGTGAFEVVVSGVTTQSGVLTLPTATTGWTCNTFNEIVSASSVTVRQVASTASSVTLQNFNSTAASDNFPTSSVIHGSCFAY